MLANTHFFHLSMSFTKIFCEKKLFFFSRNFFIHHCHVILKQSALVVLICIKDLSVFICSLPDPPAYRMQNLFSSTTWLFYPNPLSIISNIKIYILTLMEDIVTEKENRPFQIQHWNHAIWNRIWKEFSICTFQIKF